MRGARSFFLRAAESDRIIPADAGSTAGVFSCLREWGDHPRGCGEHRAKTVGLSVIGDHPRGCGEHELIWWTIRQVSGSSPRMRGAPHTAIDFEYARGIIPADAGSTQSAVRTSECAQDHPRGCGEHHGLLSPVQSMSGSSPRMRGAPGGCIEGLLPKRIIPADAGST